MSYRSAYSRTQPLLLVLALAIGLVGMRMPARVAAAPARPPAFPTITTLAATDDGAPVYVSDPTGLYRSSTAPFTVWTRRATLSSLMANAPSIAEPAISAIAPNPAQPDDLAFSIGDVLFRSTNGGITATRTAQLADVSHLVRARSTPSTLYVAGNDGQGGHIARSTDDGITWTTVYATPDVSPGIASIGDLAVDPTDASHVLAAEGLYHAGALIESRDGGATWHALPDPANTDLQQPNLVAIDPANPLSIWADWSLMGYGQLEHSADGGQTWQRVTPAAPPYSVTTSIGFDTLHGRVYVSVVDETGNRSPARIYWTADNGARFARFAPDVPALGRQLLVLGSQGILLTGDVNTPLAIFHISADGSAGQSVTPTILGNTVVVPLVSLFAGSQDGSLYALDALTGTTVWRVHTGGAMNSPVVSQGTVYAGSFDGALYAMDARTGGVRWRFNTGGAVSAPAAAGGIVYCGSRDRRLYAVDAGTGSARWRVVTGGEVTAPTVAGATVYVRSADHFLYALDAHTGALRWRFATGVAFAGTPVVAAAGLVYSGTDDGRILALDTATGKLRWQYGAGASRGHTPASLTVGAVANGVLYAGSTDNAILALDAGTGRVRWRVATGGAVQSAPAEAGGLIYAGSWDHVLYALDARTGAVRWQHDAGTSIYAAPIVRAGAVFISFADQLYALDALTGHVRWSDAIGATYTTPAVETPADPAAPGPAGSRYFPQTGHNLSGPFLAFWRRYGGLATFGYPLTEAFAENGAQLQYMERFALALVHGTVQTLPLDRTLTARRRFTPVPPFPSTNTRLYFPTTGHSLSGLFLGYWRAHHGATLLGAPISEVIVEGNGDGSGRRYPLQWFERGRLEYHAELAGTPYVMELGLLGKQELQALGW